MKSLYLKSLCLLALAAGKGFALSLYDTAPTIGLPESHAVRYSVSGSVGYDDNVNSQKTDKTSSLLLSASLGATYADFESAEKVSYSANLGATYYLKSANSSGQKLFSNNSVSATWSHKLNDMMDNSVSLSVRYTPEPDYANGISAARRQGDCFNWSVSDSFSRAMDARWSWSANASYSGNIYTNSTYQVDNRQYVNTGMSLSLRPGDLTSYSLSMSYRYDLRDYGYNSNNLSLTLGVNRSIDAFSSANLSVGIQQKLIHGKQIWSPNVRAGYNRRVAEGLSVNSYLSLDNENIDTYRGVGLNYLSNPTWRVGANLSYSWHPELSFTMGCSLLQSNYSRGERGLGNSSRTTVTPTLGVSFKFTDRLSGHVNYNCTISTSSNNGGGEYRYVRNHVTVGTSYSF